MSDDAPFDDGHGLEVRVDAAGSLLSDERDREQSLNTRGVAVAAAAVVLMSLLQRPIVSAIQLDISTCGHVALTICGGLSIGATVVVILISVLAVLRPVGRDLIHSDALQRWLTDDGMADAEGAARYQVLDASVKAIISRRDVNARKAQALEWSYRVLVAELVFAAPGLFTLALHA